MMIFPLVKVFHQPGAGPNAELANVGLDVAHFLAGVQDYVVFPGKIS